MSRWRSSIADLASVAASRSFAFIAAVTFDHSLSKLIKLESDYADVLIRHTDLLDSNSSCSLSGATDFCVTALEAESKTASPFSPCCTTSAVHQIAKASVERIDIPFHA